MTIFPELLSWSFCPAVSMNSTSTSAFTLNAGRAPRYCVMLLSAASASGSMPVWPAAGPAVSPSAATSANAVLRIAPGSNLNLRIVVSLALHRTGGEGES